jgi:CIC family chloride channel protein
MRLKLLLGQPRGSTKWPRALRHLLPLRGWVRGSEIGLTGLAIVAGLGSGALAMLIGGAVHLLHVLFYGPGAGSGLSSLRGALPWLLVLVPALGGGVLAALNLLLRRVWGRTPVDPIEANALHGGRMSLRDGAVVVAQNVASNGFGASVGMEAGYTQAGGGLSSRLGQWFGLRRAELRVMVGCGAAGAIAASFDAPLTGAFYAFELIIGSYGMAALAPVMASAVAETLLLRLLGHGAPPVMTGGIIDLGGPGFLAALLLGIACGLLSIALMRGVTFMESVFRRTRLGPAQPVLGGLLVGALALLSTSALSSGHGMLRQVFVTEPSARALLLVLAVKAAAVAVSVGAGFRGGLFFASLLLGACVGKVFVAVLEAFGVAGLDALLFGIVGMSAFAAGVVGAPLAMTFLALETTDNFLIAGYVLLAVVAANLTVRRLFGYSFATWRFHLRGEVIRSAHDVGWIRELTVGRMMRRDVRTVRADTRLASFRRDFPLGSTGRVVALDEAGRYAGMVPVAEAHSADPAGETVADLLRLKDLALLPAMTVRQAMDVFDRSEAEALAVIDAAETRRVLGTLTSDHLLRRYSEELDRRQREAI